MRAKNHIVFVSLIIAATCLFEMSLLAGLERFPIPVISSSIYSPWAY